jgi:hypothetical protein
LKKSSPLQGIRNQKNQTDLFVSVISASSVRDQNYQRARTILSLRPELRPRGNAEGEWCDQFSIRSDFMKKARWILGGIKWVYGIPTS